MHITDMLVEIIASHHLDSMSSETVIYTCNDQ